MSEVNKGRISGLGIFFKNDPDGFCLQNDCWLQWDAISKLISVSDGDMELICLPDAFVWLEELYFLFI